MAETVLNVQDQKPTGPRRPRCSSLRSDGGRCQGEASHVTRTGTVHCGPHAPPGATQPIRELVRRIAVLRRAQQPAQGRASDAILDALPPACRPSREAYPAVRALLEASPLRDVLSAAIEVREAERASRRRVA